MIREILYRVPKMFGATLISSLLLAGSITPVFATPIGPITIPTSGTATPYPSSGTVPTACTGSIISVRVLLNGFSHTFIGDVGMVLRAPNGDLLHFYGPATGNGGDAVAVNYVFRDGATPISTTGVSPSGTYAPIAVSNDTFTTIGNPPNANNSTNTFTSIFGGDNPRGTWSLYVQDFSTNDGGSITSWDVEVITNTGFTCRFGQALAASAAQTAVSGRVLDANGRGVAGATISLIGANGEPRYAATNPFGYYRFEEVTAGETYVMSATHKRYQFNAQSVNVAEDSGDVNFIAQ